MTITKFRTWKKLDELFAYNIEMNPDFTIKINKNFKADINIYERTKGEPTLTVYLTGDDDQSLYHISNIPIEKLDDVIEGLTAIAYHINSKITTAVDRELQEFDGNIDCSYEWFMSHLSRVTHTEY